MPKKIEQPKVEVRAKMKSEIAKYQGESHSYSSKRPIRKVVSRYAK